MLTTMKRASISAITLRQKTFRRAGTGSAPPVADPLPTDADAVRALAWLARTAPGDAIVYDDAVPKQGKSELSLFQKASYRRARV